MTSTWRLATLDDYEDVMNINRNIYEGLDYLPAMYKSYLHTPNRVMMVALVNEHIVGFGMLFIVDDGKTIVRQAGRIKADYQGIGLAAKSLEYGMSKCLAISKEITNFKWTSTNKLEVEKAVQKSGTKLITKRNRLSYEWSKSQLENLLADTYFLSVYRQYRASNVSHLTLSQAEELLQSSHVTVMAQNNHWIIDFEPLAAISGNARVITRGLTADVFASFEKGSNQPIAISFGSPKQRVKTLNYALDFYIHPHHVLKYRELFIAHILQHMKNASQLKFEKMLFFCFHDRKMNVKDIVNELYPWLKCSRPLGNMYLVGTSLSPKSKM